MVQELQVLRCYSCRVFQVHQVKKSKTWACKLCGEKQTLQKVYGRGSGTDCRHHVQKLNLLQGQAEEAATGTDGEICSNAVSDEDVGDESNQSLMASQEAAPMSRWKKYLEENNEEEEHEHYYSHQDCPPRSVRKRLHSPYHDGDGEFYKEDKEENISKKKKIYQSGNPLEKNLVFCKKTEDGGCLEWQDKPVLPPLPQHTGSETFLPMNTAEGRFIQSRNLSLLQVKREPKMEAVFHHLDQSKTIVPECIRTSCQDVLPSNEPTSRLSAQMSSPESSLGREDQPSGVGLKASSLQKPIIHSNLFQTDDDFDDDY